MTLVATTCPLLTVSPDRVVWLVSTHAFPFCLPQSVSTSPSNVSRKPVVSTGRVILNSVAYLTTSTLR